MIFAGGFAFLGGIELYAVELCRALRAADYDVTLCCWNNRRQSPLLYVLEELGVRVRRGLFVRGVRWDWPDRGLVYQFRRDLAAADVVWLLRVPSERAFRDLAAAAPRARMVCTITGVPRPAPVGGGGFPRQAVGRIDVLHVPCEALAARVREALAFPGRVAPVPVIPPLVQGRRLPMPPVDGVHPLRFATWGRVSGDKNLALVIDAFAEWLHRRAPGGAAATLHIYGEGPDLEPLRARAMGMAARGRILFHGAFGPDIVPQLAADNHAFVLGTSAGWKSTAALEALQWGRPVIAPPSGCLPEILADPAMGILVQETTHEALAGGFGHAAERILSGFYDPETIHAAWDARFGRRVLQERTMGVVEGLLLQ